MKKTLLLLVCTLYFTLCTGQSADIEITRPTPSVAGLSTYSTMPVSIQTGIPDISYPLISLGIANKSVSINLGLSYHAGNTHSDEWVSEVGRGWSFLGGGVISREIAGDFDESFDDSSYARYVKNEFDDIYNFSTPEESGKFRIIRDIVNNTFSIVKLTPYTSKIEYQRSANQATLILDSFTVTSETGTKYVFKDYDINTMTVIKYMNPSTGDTQYADQKYRSAFYLSSILDENNQELVKYTYLRDIKYVSGPGPQIIDAEFNKLTSIGVKDRGIIEISYDKNEAYAQHNDIFAINSIVLKTANNAFVKKYTFDYSYKPIGTSQEFLRYLNSFSQIDTNGLTIEKCAFTYENIPFLGRNNELITSDIWELTKIKLPTGGIVEYNYGFPTSDIDRVETLPIPKVVLADISFTRANGQRKYAFTLTNTKTLDIDASGIGQVAAFSWAIQFWRKVGNSFVVSHSLGQPIDPVPGLEYIQSRTFEPGEYYLDLYCNDESCPTSTLDSPAFVEIWREGDGPATQITIKERHITGPPRVKNIKYYNTSTIDPLNPPVPAKIEEYEYDKFDEPGTSSEFPVGETRIYKNVKVSSGNNMGYTKYYFRAPDAYPQQGDFWPHYNLTREGLLDKKEIYNALNQKLSEDLYDYTIEEFDGPLYSLASIQVKTSWIKNNKVTSKSYFDSGTMEIKNEIFRNTHNNKTNLERTTSSDGSIQETMYQYALEKNNQKLIGANMIGIPLETSSIVKKDASDAGKLLSRVETKYDNSGNKYPSSSVSYNSQNILASEVIFNRYDDKGNLEQYTPKYGQPVSVIWGYNKTQPIAKVEGATYDQIAPYVSNIINESNAVNISEQALQTSLDAFRNNTGLKNYSITTYVYDSLTRLKTTTPPTGIRVIYQYDTSGRLEKVEDESGKLLKKYQHNYGH
ncbi:hypothetical protein [Chryseobacterium sp. JK1]|uniref:RHS repeat domain-containing protein n=1 Tax=Chryseobacterium sp. JK1 TaxID=874294 RepID=UPI003D696A76